MARRIVNEIRERLGTLIDYALGGPEFTGVHGKSFNTEARGDGDARREQASSSV
jgi:hypothetical protein